MKLDQQLDVIRHSDPEKARAARIAADMALYDPHWTERERKARHAYYMAIARQHERKREAA